jgi:peptidoglycan/LPS O-acetylase OafA/YrhL
MYILSDLEDGKINNLTIIRLLAAISVVFAHSFPLSLGYIPELFPGFSTGWFGDIAVCAFFTLSGLLITKSYINSKSRYLFLEARLLRIFPGYVLTLLYCIFLGLLVTSADFYFYLISAFKFFYNHIVYLFFMKAASPLLEVYVHNPLPCASNGSLWSLPPEIRMYALVFLLGIVGAFKNKKILNLFLVGFIFMLCIIYLVDGYFSYKYILLDRFCAFFLRVPFFGLIKFPLAFILGMYAFLYRRYVPISPLVFLGIATVFFLLPHTFYTEVIFISYGVLFFGFHPKLVIKKLNTILPDYSYGIYIFSFPTQQTLVSLLKIYTPYYLFFLSLFLTFLVSVFSWHFIEKPSLTLKGKTKNYLLLFKEKIYNISRNWNKV